MKRRALILGCGGQDGSYLCEHLCALDYRVTGMVRRNPQGIEWIQSMLGKAEFVYGDVTDPVSIESAVRKSWPDEIYNLTAQAFNPQSWTQPDLTMLVNAGGFASLLQIVERVKPDARVFQASTAEMFGNRTGKCNEDTPFRPITPYSASKLAAHYLVDVYRQRGLFVCAGICFNHESPRRGPELVTRKIARVAAAWGDGQDEILSIGNLDSSRDWGFAGDYVKAMHLMLQQSQPSDYVIGSGRSHNVREFLHQCCMAAGLESIPEDLIQVDIKLVRKESQECLVADATKAAVELGWSPEVTFQGLAVIMTYKEIHRLNALKVHAMERQV